MIQMFFVLFCPDDFVLIIFWLPIRILHPTRSIKAPLPQRDWQSSGIRKQWKPLQNDTSKQDTNTALSFTLVEQSKHHAPFTQKICLEDFHRFVCFFVFLRRQANFWRCSCHMFVVLLKWPRLKLPTSLRCWKGKSVQPRLPVWIGRYIGPWDRCLYQHFLAWSSREMMPLGPCWNKRSKCCAAVWAEHGPLSAAETSWLKGCSAGGQFVPLNVAQSASTFLKLQQHVPWSSSWLVLVGFNWLVSIHLYSSTFRMVRLWSQLNLCPQVAVSDWLRWHQGVPTILIDWINRGILSILNDSHAIS